MRTNEEKKEAITAIVDRVINDAGSDINKEASAMIDVIINEMDFEDVRDKYVFSSVYDPARDSAISAAEWNNEEITLEQLIDNL